MHAAALRDGAARDRAPARRRTSRRCAACATLIADDDARARGALRARARDAGRAALRHDRQPRLADAGAAHARLPRARSRCARRAGGCGAIPAASCRSSTRAWRRSRPAARRRASRRCAASSCGSVGDAARAEPTRPRRVANDREKERRDERLHARRPPTQEPELDTAMKVVYQWNYDPEVDELRRLYVKATEAQWVAERDIDWDRPIDHEQVRHHAARRRRCRSSRRRTGSRCREETAWELTRRTAALPAEQLPARRAGRAHGRGAAGQRRAAHRRQVLRRDADHGRGAPRRGVRQVHQEARRGAADRARR